MSRSYVNSADLFCYVCGEVTLVSQRCSIMPLIKKTYHLYFGCKLGDQDNKWAPHVVCKLCAIRLGGWINRKGMATPFAVTMVWSVPSNHNSDCYFCLTPVTSGMNRKKKQRIDYPNIPSAIRPVPHWVDLPVPKPKKEYTLNSEMEEEDKEKTGPYEEEPTDPDFQGPASELPEKLTQDELNDLVRDLELPKVKELCQKDMACQKDSGARTQKCKASFTG